MGGRLDGKVAIVTGAARGSGEAIALGETATYVHADVTREPDWAALVPR